MASAAQVTTPSFHFRMLSDFVPTMNAESSKFVRILSGYAEQCIDICPYITLCALDIIMQTAMGSNFNAQCNPQHEYVHAILDYTETVTQRISRPWYWPGWVFKISAIGRRNQRALKTLTKYSNQVRESCKTNYTYVANAWIIVNVSEMLCI